MAVVIYTKESCPYCHMAKEFFTQRKIAFDEIRIDLDEHQLNEMIRLTGKRSVPQIFINGVAVGGYDDLAALSKSGKLDNLLNP